LAASPLEATPASIDQAHQNEDPFQAWLDMESISLPLRIRARRPGDRFHPLGMGGKSIKLSDLMINAKLPGRARAGWPLVCSRERIVWVAGIHIGHSFRLVDTTQRVLHLHLKRE
jgi:tRNA(Ile)-lysidine synthase